MCVMLNPIIGTSLSFLNQMDAMDATQHRHSMRQMMSLAVAGLLE
jgi:hypothetical protein